MVAVNVGTVVSMWCSVRVKKGTGSAGTGPIYDPPTLLLGRKSKLTLRSLAASPPGFLEVSVCTEGHFLALCAEQLFEFGESVEHPVDVAEAHPSDVLDEQLDGPPVEF